MLKRLSLLALLAAAVLLLGTGIAEAAKPEPWQMGFQEAASPVAAMLHDFHDLLLWIITAITIFVLILLVIVVVRFNEKANPTPSKTTHNTFLEIVWTAVPVLILIAIVVPSFRLLYFADRSHDAEMTLKITGHQWYWSYQYPDHGNIAFDSNIVAEEDLKPGDLRLLTVDNKVVLPVNTNIRLLMTSDDVIHNWAMPALIIKLDTVPGRTNETWVRIEKEGLYHGQCSELCGVNHGFMPIQVQAVSKEAFAAWIVEAKEKFAQTDEPKRINLASAASAVAAGNK